MGEMAPGISSIAHARWGKALAAHRMGPARVLAGEGRRALSLMPTAGSGQAPCRRATAHSEKRCGGSR
jgi:hypothetical protein